MGYTYIHVISAGPPIIVRVPSNPRGGSVLTRKQRGPAYTQLMAEHGLRQYDISALEEMLVRPSSGLRSDDFYVEESRKLQPRLEAAFSGDSSAFHLHFLYDWEPSSARFILLRAPSGKE